MTDDAEFGLLPIDRLRPHEEVDEEKVRLLMADLVAAGVFREPIWVARGSYVILNGHHRVAALRGLGAKRAPAWSVIYASADIRLDRWEPGPPISKEEVLRRAEEGRLFGPRTTRHSFANPPPARTTPLAALGIGPRGVGAHSASGERGGSSARRTSPPG